MFLLKANIYKKNCIISLGLPTRDYFLQSSNLQYLNAYREYMITVITLMGADPINATFIAAEIINFETK